MRSKIFQLINGELVEQNEASYEQEEILQRLLKENPDLMDGAQIDEDNPRRWLLIKREASVLINDDTGNYGYVDHLFLDQDGIPTLVEVKRSENTQIRRYVVGQMMDYAANARNTWQNGRIKQYFDANCEADGKEADQVLDDFLGPEGDTDQFWEDVETNLRAGKLRLLFVADHIPKELKAIIEFLNEQFTSIEVLGFEIPQFKGGDTITLVPKLIGQTATSRTVKQTRSGKRWTEKTCFDKFHEEGGDFRLERARHIFDWAKSQGMKLWFGTGSTMASFVPQVVTDSMRYALLAVFSGGQMEIYFQHLKKHAPFNDKNKRMEMLLKMNEIEGVNIPESKIDSRPSLIIDELSIEQLNQILKVHEWVVREIRKSEAKV